MCGINIIMRFNGLSMKDKLILNEMNKLIVSRGPDGEGVFFDEFCAMAMRRLSIVDEKGGKQPMVSRCGKYVLIYNGEIYNYKELKKQLKSKGYLFDTESDTEVILNTYLEYGNSCIDLFQGMFSFIIYNISEKSIFISRDKLGIKPLYYYCSENIFVASSSLDSLKLMIEKINVSINSISLYLFLSYIPHPYTIYNEVYKLEPGCCIRFSLDNKKIFKIFPNNYKNIYGIKTNNKNFYEIFRNDLSRQINIEVNYGIFLSAGIDSNSILSIIADLKRTPLNVLSVGFMNGIDETKIAEKSAKKYNSNFVSLNVSSEDLLTNINSIIDALDEPISDPSILPTYLISKMARKQGLKVVFSGAGGDELFAGYHRYRKYFFRNIISFFDKINIFKNYSRFSTIIFRILNWRYDFILSVSGFNTSFGAKILNKKFYKKSRSVVDSFLNDNLKKNSLNEKLKFDRIYYLPCDILALTDKLSMANSIECRVPYSNPNYYYLYKNFKRKSLMPNNNLKYIQKEIFKNTIIPEVLLNKKIGFAGPVELWIENNIDYILNEIMNNKNSIFIEIINKKIIKKKMGYSKSETLTLWSLFILSKWIEKRFK